VAMCISELKNRAHGAVSGITDASGDERLSQNAPPSNPVVFNVL
jgi:hypothetical protein